MVAMNSPPRASSPPSLSWAALSRVAVMLNSVQTKYCGRGLRSWFLGLRSRAAGSGRGSRSGHSLRTPASPRRTKMQNNQVRMFRGMCRADVETLPLPCVACSLCTRSWTCGGAASGTRNGCLRPPFSYV